MRGTSLSAVIRGYFAVMTNCRVCLQAKKNHFQQITIKNLQIIYKLHKADISFHISSKTNVDLIR